MIEISSDEEGEEENDNEEGEEENDNEEGEEENDNEESLNLYLQNYLIYQIQL